MIAGEFAVLEPYQKLIVMAVDRFVYVTINDQDKNELNLEDFKLNHLEWEYDQNLRQIKIASSDKRLRFVKDVLLITHEYLLEQNIIPKPFSLSVRSELDDQSGVKYGLGSSAAVVTAVVTAILTKHLPENPPKELIFKLAAIAHVKTQGNGSGADIAASTYGGLLEYASFQADWLTKQYSKKIRLTELVEMKWKYLSIKRLSLPEQVNIYVGWTGKPASTASLVSQLLKLRETNLKQFEQFLQRSREAVNDILQGIEESNIPQLFSGIEKNRQALATVGKQANVEIETNLLYQLSQVAKKYNGAGKLSGAGGGDCGIAFVLNEQSKNELYTAWEAEGIKPLNIQLYPNGAERM